MTGKKWFGPLLVLATLALLVVVKAQTDPPLDVDAQATTSTARGASLGTGFTYQGQLTTDGEPVTDSCSAAFRLFDQAVGGSQVGSAITQTVPISAGLFTVNLDFGGGIFTGDARWLGIVVKCTGDSAYADLGRQELTAAPYALYSLDADLLDGKDSTEFVTADHTHSGTLVNVYRAQIFGHSFHSTHYCTSTEYEAVAGTFSSRGNQFPAPAPGTQRWYRVEVSFAVNHDQTIYLRMRDPWNNMTLWEHSFTGGHAYNDWWSWGTTSRFTLPLDQQPWPRQRQLEIKASDTSGAYLGSVWIVAEDVVP